MIEHARRPPITFNRIPATTEEIAARFAPLAERPPEPRNGLSWWHLLFPIPLPGVVLLLVLWWFG